MGIIVTVAMLLALLCLNSLAGSRKTQAVAGVFALLSGCWNTLWYGLQNLGHFWGWAALVSGVFMIVAGILLLQRLRADVGTSQRRWYHWVLSLGLGAGFLLYAVTIVQLNLGLEIIR